MDKAKKYFYPALITLVICGGFFVRFWHLETVPPGVHYDEAYNGLDAIWANETGDYKIFYPENTGREGLHINVIAFFIKIFGNTNLGLRFANAMWGSFTILGFFLLLRELKFSRPAVFLGTFIISTSFWHLVFSRMAYRAIMVPFILVWAFYFFWKGMNSLESGKGKTNRRVYFWLALSGIFLGLGFHTYIAFRVAPLIFLAVGFSFIFSRKNFLRENWKIIFIFAAALFAVLAPLAGYFFGNFDELVYRSGSVSIFNAPGMSPLSAFWKSFSTHLSAFFVFGDHNPRHNYNDQPLLPHIWAVLFALGFLISFWEVMKSFLRLVISFRIVKFLKNKLERSVFFSKFPLNRWLLEGNFEENGHSQTVFFKNFAIRENDSSAGNFFQISVLAQSMFWVMLIPGVLSIEGIPHSLRIIGTIPAVFLMMALALEYFWEIGNRISGLDMKLAKKVRLLFFGIIILLILGGASQVYLYFSKWAGDTRTEGGYERKLYNLGLLVRDLPVKKNNYIITALNTTIYDNHKKSSLKTTEYIGYPASQKYLFYKPLEASGEISCDDPQIVFLESDQWLRDQYAGLCPGLIAKRFSFDNGKYLFWVVSREK